MDGTPRHQCMIYTGAPSGPLPGLAELLRDKLAQNYRCLYLNNPTSVAAMRSALGELGVDAACSGLLMSSDLPHLTDHRWFSVDRMLDGLEEKLADALKDGYRGLWATGDMAWEFGPEEGFMKLLDYEWRLEEFFHSHPQLEGVCQYHVDTLPEMAVREGLLAHPGVLLNRANSSANPYYVAPENFADELRDNPEVSKFIEHLCSHAESTGLPNRLAEAA